VTRLLGLGLCGGCHPCSHPSTLATALTRARSMGGTPKQLRVVLAAGNGPNSGNTEADVRAAGAVRAVATITARLVHQNDFQGPRDGPGRSTQQRRPAGGTWAALPLAIRTLMRIPAARCDHAPAGLTRDERDNAFEGKKEAQATARASSQGSERKLRASRGYASATVADRLGNYPAVPRTSPHSAFAG